jgi:cytosine deaminase
MTRVPELMAAGVTVTFGHDCAMDPWYGRGSGDMLQVAHTGLHVAQMTSQKGIRACFDAVTVNDRINEACWLEGTASQWRNFSCGR